MNKLTHLRHKQQGFTLVEIAIVLVIIGLLLGAVFKGQELIAQAKIKNTQKQIDEVRAMYYTYLDKTGGVPGDNNGDGIIDSNENNSDENNSDSNFWTALNNEKLLSNASASAPKNPYGIALQAVGSTTLSKNAICTKVPEAAAEQIDRKIDDGNLKSGSLINGGTDSSVTFPASDSTSPGDETPGDELTWLCATL